MITIDDILTIVLNLMRGKVNEMLRAFMQKGGWENWMQVELAMALGDNFGDLINVQRENSDPYKADSKSRVDILVSGASILRPFAIELKTESLFQSGERNLIGVLAGADFEKIVKLGKRNDYQFMQFALGMSPEGSNSLALLSEKINAQPGQQAEFIGDKVHDTIVSLLAVVFKT